MHNAFEIRQTGDIYVADVSAPGGYYEKPMIHLQHRLYAIDSSIKSLQESGGSGSGSSGAVNYVTSIVDSTKKGLSADVYTNASTNIGDGAVAFSVNGAATGRLSFAMGNGVKTLNEYAFGFGYASQALGEYVNTTQRAEHGAGRFNISSSTAISDWGNAGNTLLSIGNGSGTSNRHNALEIKQSGDIYVADVSATGSYYEKPMINLQEKLYALDASIAYLAANPGSGGSSINPSDFVDVSTWNEHEKVIASALVNLKSLEDRIEAFDESIQAQETALLAEVHLVEQQKADTSTVYTKKEIDKSDKVVAAALASLNERVAIDSSAIASIESRMPTFSYDSQTKILTITTA